MPTRIKPNPSLWRIRVKQPCLDPNHMAPAYMVIPPGHRLVHTCPACGKETIIVPAEVTIHV